MNDDLAEIEQIAGAMLRTVSAPERRRLTEADRSRILDLLLAHAGG